ncbi:MAG: mycoredoxin [Catenulispora sp.]|nr:mycoredoxin [Catenulispora sp.]NUR63858.1 mycoredoxin [Catenulispora sp.]
MTDSSGEVIVYWRPGCSYCWKLRRGLRATGLHYREVDIWDDPEAKAFVRSVANGDETVPTVVVAGHAMVNPSVSTVLAAVEEYAPDLVTADVAPARRPWWRRIL